MKISLKILSDFELLENLPFHNLMEKAAKNIKDIHQNYLLDFFEN